jgi:hypothetical protein
MCGVPPLVLPHPTPPPSTASRRVLSPQCVTYVLVTLSSWFGHHYSPSPISPHHPVVCSPLPHAELPVADRSTPHHFFFGEPHLLSLPSSLLPHFVAELPYYRPHLPPRGAIDPFLSRLFPRDGTATTPIFFASDHLPPLGVYLVSIPTHLPSPFSLCRRTLSGRLLNASALPPGVAICPGHPTQTRGRFCTTSESTITLGWH